MSQNLCHLGTDSPPQILPCVIVCNILIFNLCALCTGSVHHKYFFTFSSTSSEFQAVIMFTIPCFAPIGFRGKSAWGFLEVVQSMPVTDQVKYFQVWQF